jgi:predicted DCC family thiol-disulfide oxidoreductase YuxK
MEPDAKTTVYYDGACPVCVREIGAYRACAGAERIDWVDVAALGDGAAVAPGLSRTQAMARFHVRTADGALLSGAAAFAALWRVLPAWVRLGRIAAWPPVALVLEAAYRSFLKLRRLWRA